MKKGNKLPEIWSIRNDGTKKFRDIVIPYLEKIMPFRSFPNIKFYYYGVPYFGISAIGLHSFGKVLTIDEFIELSGVKDNYTFQPNRWDYVYAYSSKDKYIPKQEDIKIFIKTLIVPKKNPDGFKSGIYYGAIDICNKDKYLHSTIKFKDEMIMYYDHVEEIPNAITRKEIADKMDIPIDFILLD